MVLLRPWRVGHRRQRPAPPAVRTPKRRTRKTQRQRSGRQKEGLEYSSANGPEEGIESPVKKQPEESRLLTNIFLELWIRIWDPEPYFRIPYFKLVDLSYIILDFILLNYRMHLEVQKVRNR
jgi:hypothetical protein